MSTDNNALCCAENSSLLLVDIQTHLTAVMPAKVLARLQRNTSLLIHSANKLGIPVYACEQYPKGLGPLEEDIKKILPDSSPIYEKTVFSCGEIPEFKQALSTSKRQQVIIAGMEAHVCVLQTAIDLFNQGYSVFVVADAVCSRHRESYETALQRLRSIGIGVCDAESVVFEWLDDAKHEHFKEIQALIR